MSEIKPYLCGAISGTSGKHEWRERAIQYFPLAVDPMRRDYRGREIGLEREIVDLDKLDIELSCLVLANISAPSWGTAMEIHYAHSIGKVVVCFGAVYVSPWLVYHSTKIAGTLEEARDWIFKVFPR